MSEQPGRRETSVAGLVGALLVLLVGVGAFVVLRDVNRVDPADPVRTVDYAAPARFAQQAAQFELLAPRRLPEGWVATSVRFEDDPEEQSWHLGLLTDEQRYIGVEQAQRTIEAMVEDFVDEDATQVGEVDVDGTTWSRWAEPGRDPDADVSAASGADLALVRQTGEAVALVVGRAPEQHLTTVAASLR